MGFASHLIHLCTIERPTTAHVNAHGLNNDRYLVVYESQPCRLVVRTEHVADSQSAEAPVITMYTMLFPADADIGVKDRISAIALDDGTLLDGKFIIDGVMPRRAKSTRHISVSLKKIA